MTRVETKTQGRSEHIPSPHILSIISHYSQPEGNYPSPTHQEQADQLADHEQLVPYLDRELIEQGIQDCADYLRPLLGPTTSVVVNMQGGRWFAEALARYLPEFRYQAVRMSRSAGRKEFGDIKETETQLPTSDQLNNTQRIMVIEDINDEGVTLKRLVEELQKLAPQAQVMTVCLFEKLIDAPKQHTPHYIVFEVKDAFLVGRGLDEGTNRFRELENVYVLTETTVN